MQQAIEPMYECRNDIDIFADLARRIGIEGYNDKTEREWLRELTRDAIDDFEAFAAALVMPFDIKASANFDDLVTQRVQIATMDLRIASIALSERFTLLTRNSRDFSKVPGLVIEDWTV